MVSKSQTIEQQLCQAIENDDLDLAQLLLDKGANPMANQGRAVVLALDEGFLDFFSPQSIKQGCIQARANIALAAARRGILDWLDWAGDLPRQTLSDAFVLAASNGHTGVLEYIDRSLSQDSIRSRMWCDALEYTIQDSQIENVRKILSIWPREGLNRPRSNTAMGLAVLYLPHEMLDELVFASSPMGNNNAALTNAVLMYRKEPEKHLPCLRKVLDMSVFKAPGCQALSEATHESPSLSPVPLDLMLAIASRCDANEDQEAYIHLAGSNPRYLRHLILACPPNDDASLELWHLCLDQDRSAKNDLLFKVLDRHVDKSVLDHRYQAQLKTRRSQINRDRLRKISSRHQHTRPSPRSFPAL